MSYMIAHSHLNSLFKKINLERLKFVNNPLGFRKIPSDLCASLSSRRTSGPLGNLRPCKKSSVDEPYHQMNCIEASTYKEIQNKYNCTFHSTLFSIQGFRQCPWHYLGLNNYNRLKSEFSESCLKECPLESCFSEKFFFYTTRSVHFS